MNRLGVTLDQWLARIGMVVPVDYDGSPTVIAALLAIAAWSLAWLAARRSAPRLQAFVTARLHRQDEVLAQTVERLVRFAVAALLLWIVLAVYAWDPVSRVVLGINVAVAATLFVNRFMRFLNMPRWAAAALSFLLLAAIFARLLGGLTPIMAALDAIGFDAGRTRISLLAVLRIGVTAILLFAAVRLVNRLVHHGIDDTRGLDPTQKLLVEKLVGIAVVVVAFLIGIDVLGIDLTALAVFSGALGLAIGFGLQKTFGNLLAGIILLMDRSVKPGDVIAVGESFGWVNKIGIRAVSVLTRDGKEHLIPNENLMTSEVENWSFSSRNVRVRIPVGVSYHSDMDTAERLMRQAAHESPRVLDHPSPNVWMTEYAANSVNFEILVWISDPEEGVGNVRSDVLKRLWVLFRDNGVEVPFPQRDIHLRELPPELIERLGKPQPGR